MQVGDHVFHDPRGRRAKWVRGTLVATGFLASGLLGLFSVSLVARDTLQPQRSATQINRFLLSLDRRKADHQLAQLKAEIGKRLGPRHTAPLRSEGRIVLAYFAPWEDTALASLRAHADSLTHLAPVWLTLNDTGTAVDFSEFDPGQDPGQQKMLAIAREAGLRIVPVLSNAKEAVFSPQRVHSLLQNPEIGKRVIDSLTAWCKQNEFSGINFDFEELPDSDGPRYQAFLEEAKTAFHAQGLELSAAIQADTPPSLVASWAEELDYLVLMAYDEHEDSSAPGPIASLDWVDGVLESALQKVPEEKVILGLGSYGYDWTKGGSRANAVAFQEAMALAAGFRDTEKAADVIRFDPESMNSTFTYEETDGSRHTVWLLDGPSVANLWKLGQQRGIRGAALWTLGTEDPSVWTFLDRRKLEDPVNPSSLDRFHFPFEVDYEGKGEVLKVVSRPEEGERQVTSDETSGFIDEVVYKRYATPYVVRKQGYKPGKLVLTFDDGPDPTWTPQILDKLHQYGVPAAFFCIGNNVESWPNLVQRAYREGHEIGNHSFLHPDLGAVSPQRANLEIVATQRVIEATLGRSTVLFRPPYNADSQPTSSIEMRPVELAEKLDLTTVGENVDPNDWDSLAPGGGRRRSAQDISRLVLDDLARRKRTGEEGNIILLHDAGGDRSQTVAALDLLIPALKARGYQFTTIADLLGRTRDQVMPSLPARDSDLIAADRTVFTVLHWGQVALNTGFLCAIALGLGRILIVVPLALFHNARRKRGDFAVGTPSVGVLIAAYNEEKTIEKTVASVLRSDYPVTEVIVIDDGSQDGTADVLRQAFSQDTRVRLIQKANGGKASALNQAIATAQSELLLTIDADTVLDSRAIGFLARHFGDERIGAVAGSVEVGNIKNVLTAWQSVEYRTSQNIDRRAYAFLDAVTVVPGAVGMWRKDLLEKLGGFPGETLAEDMDLTWAVHEAGYRIETEPMARAYTEAPESWRALTRQRFRWAFGTFQCMWKHRRALGRHGWFGWFALPSLWLFQVAFQVLGPFVDLQILVSAVFVLMAALQPHSAEVSNSAAIQSLHTMVLLYSAFFTVELLAGIVAYRLDKVRPTPLVWLFLQRFAYRQLMYIVMLKTIWFAVTGARQGWRKLQRTGNVTVSG
ncbi:MAG: glycosyltransferase [Armatimonadetes bacterium]|nr:glycosyltransferase [Armatimonadota bacterium]